MRVFFCIFIKKSPAALRRLLAVCILEKLCFSCRPSPLPCRFPRMRMILFAILYIIYKLLQFVSFVLFLQRRRFLAILFAFFVYFYVLSKILGEFFVQNKTRNTKRRIFLFFSSVVRKFLSISLFLLCPLFFVTALSPAPPEKPRTDFFTAQHFFLISAEENSHFAVCFARSRLCTESFFLPNCEFYSGKISRRELSAQQNISLFSWEENSFFTGIFLSIQQKKTRNLLIIYKEINL